MSLLFSIAEQIESSALGVAIAESRFAYPVIEGIHLIGLAVSVGLIFLTDLRLMGLILTRVPVELFDTPEELAAGAVYLASSEAAYVTGQTLHVNGGMAMI